METFSVARPSLLRIYWLEAKYEFIKLLRMPAFAIRSNSGVWIFGCPL